MKLATIAITCLAAVSLLGIKLDAQHEAVKEQAPLPLGWHLLKASENDLTLALQCLIHATDITNSWNVSSPNGTLAISRGWRESEYNVNLPSGMVREEGMSGHESVLVVVGGTLLGFDAGEFGGGLWFLPKDSLKPVRMSRLNVIDIIAIDKGAIILTGNEHLPRDSGEAYFLADNEGKLTLSLTVDLGAAPIATIRDGSASSIILNNNEIFRLDDSGHMQRIATLPPHLKPTSVAIDKYGAIYVGMAFVVLRIHHIGEKYISEILVSDSCHFSQITTNGAPYCSCNAGK